MTALGVVQLLNNYCNILAVSAHSHAQKKTTHGTSTQKVQVWWVHFQQIAVCLTSQVRQIILVISAWWARKEFSVLATWRRIHSSTPHTCRKNKKHRWYILIIQISQFLIIIWIWGKSAVLKQTLKIQAMSWVDHLKSNGNLCWR